MRLVDREQAHLHTLRARDHDVGTKALGRDIQKLRIAMDAIIQRNIDLGLAHTRMDRRGGDISPFELLNLVLHQGDQRRYHNANAFGGHHRHLETNGFPAAGRKQYQRVHTIQDRLNGIFLKRPEIVITPILFQDRPDISHQNTVCGVVFRFYKVIALGALSKAGSGTFDKKKRKRRYLPSYKTRYLTAKFHSGP